MLFPTNYRGLTHKLFGKLFLLGCDANTANGCLILARNHGREIVKLIDLKVACV